MQDQCTRAETGRDPWAEHRVVLDLLVDNHPAQWTITELTRALCPSAEARLGEEPSTVSVEDALNYLYSVGLIHRVGQFAFASRAATEVARLRD